MTDTTPRMIKPGAEETPKPRSIAACNGATTTPPLDTADIHEDDLLSVDTGSAKT